MGSEGAKAAKTGGAHGGILVLGVHHVLPADRLSWIGQHGTPYTPQTKLSAHVPRLCVVLDPLLLLLAHTRVGAVV